MQKGHRFGYDKAISSCNIKFVEVSTLEEYERAFNDHTVMAMYYNGAEGDQAPVGRPNAGYSRWERAERYGRDLGIVAWPSDFGPPSVDDNSGLDVAQNFQSQLRALGVANPVIIVSSDYSGMQPSLANASYLVVIPGFNSTPEAVSACAAIGKTCLTYEPGTRNAGAPPPVTLP